MLYCVHSTSNNSSDFVELSRFKIENIFSNDRKFRGISNDLVQRPL